jgi:hypothetical protein
MECEIASLLEKAPQLVKLGISLEFRETLNKTALQLQKNLDQSTNLLSSPQYSDAIIWLWGLIDLEKNNS